MVERIRKYLKKQINSKCQPYATITETEAFLHLSNLCILVSSVLCAPVCENHSQYIILKDVSIPKTHLEHSGGRRQEA